MTSALVLLTILSTWASSPATGEPLPDQLPEVMSQSTTLAWYDRHAEALAADYEAEDPAILHGWVLDLLPKRQGLVLDVGAGTGRDAAWLASHSLDVVALEPSKGMRERAATLHPERMVRWLDDRLPELRTTSRLGLQFDLIWLSAVWQHVASADRPRAFRKLTALLKPGGLMLLTLRHGPADAARAMHPVSVDEIEQLARQHGLAVVRVQPQPDRQRRAEISWIGMVLRLPDDGTGALPLLRHIILNDGKSSTYKLGLLRALCRLADGAAGLARDDDTSAHVTLPLGAVALTWLRLYLPLLRADLPQSPANRQQGEKLGFVRNGLRALLQDELPAQELRVGARFTGSRAAAVVAALADAVDTIVRMPATYMTYPNGGPVLPAERQRPAKVVDAVLLDAPLLHGFGSLKVPRPLWQALQRYGCWIEPTLVAEWIRLMKGYAAGQDRVLPEARLAVATAWLEPERDVAVPRGIALHLLEEGQNLYCVWSGKALRAEALDIDHCFPWAAWPCSDLWNLLPADRRVNQQEKRDRLPSEAHLAAAAGPIAAWWGAAYQTGQALPQRFAVEALASLPGLGDTAPADLTAGRLLTAMQLQRLRLRHDGQVPEWHMRRPFNGPL